METSKTNTIKRVISWAIGIPAAFLMVCEIEDLSKCWIQLVAMIAIAALMIWNRDALKETD